MNGHVLMAIKMMYMVKEEGEGAHMMVLTFSEKSGRCKLCCELSLP